MYVFIILRKRIQVVDDDSSSSFVKIFGIFSSIVFIDLHVNKVYVVYDICERYPRYVKDWTKKRAKGVESAAVIIKNTKGEK